MYEWLVIYFLSAVFQSYQDDGKVILKGCVQRNLVSIWKFLPQAGIEHGIATSVGQHLTHWSTKAT